MSNHITAKVINSPRIRSTINTPPDRLRAEKVITTFESQNLSNANLTNSTLIGTTNVDGTIALSQGSEITHHNIVETFLDNTTKFIIIGDKTQDRVVELFYSMTDGTETVTGVIEVSHDGTNIFVDDERTVNDNDIETIDITSTFVTDSWRLNLNGIGPGNTIEFKYFINKRIKV
jgi:hypothetical protein